LIFEWNIPNRLAAIPILDLQKLPAKCFGRIAPA